MYQTSGGWARRWPLAVAAVALVAISVSAGILIERSRGDDKKNNDSESQPDADKATLPKLGGPQGNKNSAPQASLGSATAPAVGSFVGTVTSTVCRRLNTCGMLNDFSKQLCDELAKKTDPSAAAKVRKGQCTYNKRAAKACLNTIGKLKCNMTSSNVMDWVDSASKLSDCATAFTCR